MLSLYIFVSINDLILYAFNAVQMKNALLLAALTTAFLGTGRWFKRQAHLFYFLVPLLILSMVVGLANANSTSSNFQQAFSVAVVILIPLMIDRYAGTDTDRWKYVSNVIMFSLVFMIVFKIVFVLYQMGIMGNAILDIVFRNIQGRGEIDGVARLNTGTQLLMLYGLILCVTRLLKSSGKFRFMYIFIAALFALDLFIASSRFFTIIAPVAVIITLFFCGVKIPRSVFFGIGICALLIAGFLFQDLYDGRVSTQDAGDGIRDEQIATLLNAFIQAPLLGHGSGYTIPSLTRSEDTPFIYEVQVIAFLMQFGILGTLLFAGSIFQLLKPHISSGLMMLSIFFVAVFFFASYYNPYLLGTYAGLSLAMIVVILRYLSVIKNGVVK